MKIKIVQLDLQRRWTIEVTCISAKLEINASRLVPVIVLFKAFCHKMADFINLHTEHIITCFSSVIFFAYVRLKLNWIITS